MAAQTLRDMYHSNDPNCETMCIPLASYLLGEPIYVLHGYSSFQYGLDWSVYDWQGHDFATNPVNIDLPASKLKGLGPPYMLLAKNFYFQFEDKSLGFGSSFFEPIIYESNLLKHSQLINRYAGWKDAYLFMTELENLFKRNQNSF